MQSGVTWAGSALLTRRPVQLGHVVPIQPRVLRAFISASVARGHATPGQWDFWAFCKVNNAACWCTLMSAVDGDRSVSWRITSEGEERIRYIRDALADGEDAHARGLEISDRQPRFEYPRGAGGRGRTQLGRFPTGARRAARRRSSRRSNACWRSGCSVTAAVEPERLAARRQHHRGLCDNQRNRLMMSGERSASTIW